LVFLAVFASFAVCGPLIDYAKGDPYPYTGELNNEGHATNYFPFDRSCPGFCSGHGECIDHMCECELGFSGLGCETATCPNNCTGKGICTEGECECRKGYTGRDCSIETCPSMCSGKGRCFEGECFCDLDWNGTDCSNPRWGIPGMSRPPKAGLPDSFRFNSSCMVFRVPPMLVETEGPALTNASVLIKNNQTCAKNALIAGGFATVTSLEVSDEYPPERNITIRSGDTMVCGVFQGCDDIKLESVYGDRRLAFINGIGVPAPLPPAPLPNQVHISYCADRYNCSGRGVCVNVTLPVSRQYQYECHCNLPWIPPNCRVLDHLDTSAPNEDPMWKLNPGQLPFNQVPCTHDDNCFACDEVLTSMGEWAKVGESPCTWDSVTSRCRHNDDGYTAGTWLSRQTCRSSRIPEQLLPPKPK